MNKAQLIKYLLGIRASYWFIPTLMVTGAVFLSVYTVWLDGQISVDWPEKVPFLFSNKPDGARALLATVAGSMITVAGVTFSLTLLAVSHATAQFGPRLLNNFMRDRGNQITLGTFVATFIYCLLVLRTVRTAEEPPHGSENVEGLVAAFVPHVSISIALILSLCSVGVLIYFIHHVPESIRLSNVVSNVGRQLCRAIDDLFPETIANPDADDDGDKADHGDNAGQVPDGFFDDAVSIELDQSGYVQSVDEDRILELAKELDVTIFIKHRPGDFYCKSTELIYASPADNVSEEASKNLGSLFALGTHRTLSQNAMFAVDQLVEVAQRALSPGVNDPMTAMYCLDWLKAGLVELTKREKPSVFRYDDSGQLRVFTREIAFADFCRRVFDQLRQYVAKDLNTALHMMRMIKVVRHIATRESHKQVLDEHAERLVKSAEQSGFTEFDVAELRGVQAQSDMAVERATQDPP